MHPLDGCREKVTRAGDHLATLDSESRRFVEEQQYAFAFETDAKTGEKVIRLRSRRQPALDPPVRLGIIAGDVLHNLRSALDHLVWQLATIGKGPGERNQFPIFDTPKQFKEKRAQYLKGVLPKHRTMIEGHQPYKGGPTGRALTVLAKLNDIDKHRVVHAGVGFGLTGPGTISLSNVRSAEIRGREVTHLVDGTELYRIGSMDVIDPKAQVQVETKVSYSIAFGDLGTFAASRADLLICRDVVSNIIEGFRGEFVGEPTPEPGAHGTPPGS
jgi:hypothetical protein